MTDPVSPARVADTILQSGNTPGRTPGRTPKPMRHAIFTPPRNLHTHIPSNDPFGQGDFTQATSSLLSGFEADISSMEGLPGSSMMSPGPAFFMSPPRGRFLGVDPTAPGLGQAGTPKLKSPIIKPFPVTSPYRLMSSPSNAFACHSADMLRNCSSSKKAKRRLLADTGAMNTSDASTTSALDMSSSSTMSHQDHDTSATSNMMSISPSQRGAPAGGSYASQVTATTTADSTVADGSSSISSSSDHMPPNTVMVTQATMVAGQQAAVSPVPADQVAMLQQQQQQQLLFTEGQQEMTGSTQFAQYPQQQQTVFMQQQQMQQQPDTGATMTTATGGVRRSSSDSRSSRSSRPRKGTAAKRGEYKCGKCGFFPKKAKHNCALERAKRAANQSKTAAMSKKYHPTQHQHQHQQQAQAHHHQQQQQLTAHGMPSGTTFAVVAPGSLPPGVNMVQLNSPANVEGFSQMLTGNW